MPLVQLAGIVCDICECDLLKLDLGYVHHCVIIELSELKEAQI